MKPILILLLAIVAATTTLLTTTPIQGYRQLLERVENRMAGGQGDNPQPDRVGAGDDNEDGVQDTPRDGPGRR